MDDLLHKAGDLYKQGDKAGAIQLLEQLVQQEPVNGRILDE